jgi:formate/nitrite transporter FocA (FNT family)
LAVILARQQLFTENTLTAVLPVMSKPTWANVGRLLRLWSVVLVGNLCGTLLVAYVMLHLPIFDTKTDHAFLEIGRKIMENSRPDVRQRHRFRLDDRHHGVDDPVDGKRQDVDHHPHHLPDGAGDFTHIVVGSAEVSYLVFAGELPWKDFWLVFAGPTLAGNIVGGSFIFALISHAQIRSESSLPIDSDKR